MSGSRDNQAAGTPHEWRVGGGTAISSGCSDEIVPDPRECCHVRKLASPTTPAPGEPRADAAPHPDAPADARRAARAAAAASCEPGRSSSSSRALTYLFVWRRLPRVGIDSASATIPDMEEERGPTAAAATAATESPPPPLPADAPPPPRWRGGRRWLSRASPPPPPPRRRRRRGVRRLRGAPGHRPAQGDLRDHADGAHSLAECCELCEQQGSATQTAVPWRAILPRNSGALLRTSPTAAPSPPQAARASASRTSSANECWLKADVDSGPAPQRASSQRSGRRRPAGRRTAPPPPPPSPPPGRRRRRGQGAASAGCHLRRRW